MTALVFSIIAFYCLALITLGWHLH